MYIRSFRPVDLTDMYLTFLDAFSDYPVGFRLSKDQFVRKFVEKLHISFDLSVGAYEGDGLAGFIFTSVNQYASKLTAYNGGTGVRPRYRGQGIVPRLYTHLLPLFHQKSIEQCVLEVLVNNTRAIHVYEQLGFEKTRFFHCFKLENAAFPFHNRAQEVYVEQVMQPDWLLYQECMSYTPSFLDSTLMVRENLTYESVIEAKYEGKCVGFAIYQAYLGRISQIAVHPEYRQKGIGTKLMHHIYQHSATKELTIINVDAENTATRAFFESLGFADQLQQHEMILHLAQ
jgi:ribosomal protein S18 acetylase RimI-like enzyme